MAVSKAVTSGRLIKCIVYDEKGDKKIDYSIAVKEVEEINLGGEKRKQATPINVEPKQDVNTKKQEPPKTKVTSNLTEITDDTSYKEGLRIEKLYKARLLKLEADEKEGTLVNKDDVYKELYKRGDLLKTILLALPDRITDDLMTLADNRSDFHNRLSKEIEDALREFSYQ